MEEAGQHKKKPGLFVVIEGIDGSGSTTQVREILRFLRQRRQRSFVTHEPSEGPAGLTIRLALNNRLIAAPDDADLMLSSQSSSLDPAMLALLFAADRVDHMRTKIQSNLKAGRHVVTDRYLLSSLAYQGVYFDREWLLSINRFAIRPDITFFLDLLPEQAMARINQDRDKKDMYENTDQLSLVREQYLDAIHAEIPALGPIVIVDAARPAATVTKHILGVFERFMTTGEVLESAGELSLF